MNIGEYWVASSADVGDETEWLFLIVATTTVNRRRYFLGVKCCWEKRKPEWEPSLSEIDYTGTWWFSSDGRCTDENAPFDALAYRTGWRSTKFLLAPSKRA